MLSIWSSRIGHLGATKTGYVTLLDRIQVNLQSAGT
jgi:hypothetical protein